MTAVEVSNNNYTQELCDTFNEIVEDYYDDPTGENKRIVYECILDPVFS